MNGTSHRTMSPAPTGPTPARRASPVARRLRLGSDVSAFCRLAITRRNVAHLPRPSLSPSAASKLLALLVALVALATANAQVVNLAGSIGGGSPYATDTANNAAVTTAQALSTAVSATGYWAGFTSSSYTSDIAPHIPSAGTTWTKFVSAYGTANAVVADYISTAVVSPDFKT